MKKQITFTQAFQEKYWEQRHILIHLEKFNQNKEVDWNDFTKPFLSNWCKYIKNKTSQNTARQYCKYIKVVLNTYNKVVELPNMEYNEHLRLKAIDTINICLTKKELQKLIQYIPIDEIEHTVRNQFLLSCFTGMRYSDVINFDMHNIEKNTIIFYTEKTNDTISVPSSPIVIELLKQSKTKVYDNSYFNRTIKTICKNLGIKDTVKTVRAGKHYTGEKWKYITAHTARRTYATNLYQATKDLHLISQFMGHKDTKQTLGYICIQHHDNKEVNNYLNGFRF